MATLSLVFFFYFFIFIRFEVETAKSGKSGPYKLDFQKVEPCEDQGTKDIIWHDLKKEENGLYSVKIYLGRAMDRDSKICVEGQEIFSDGSTKHLQFNCKTCAEAWMFLGDFFSNVMNAAGFKPEVCGFRKGNFTATNWDASRPFSILPVMNYNTFIFKCTNYDGDEKIGCNIFHARVIPK